jgi:hypothetical protein
MTSQQACSLAGEIVLDVAQQRRRPAEPGTLAVRVLRALVQEVRRDGTRLGEVSGPWRVGRSARPTGASAPTVERGAFSMYVDLQDQPEEIAALLNWCGIDEPDPTLRARTA